MLGSHEDIKSVQSELYAKFFSGLANPTRFKIVETLLEGEKTVTDLVDTLGASQSQVSNHLACLKWCGYVSCRQEGKFIYYQVTDQRIREILNLAKMVVADNALHITSCTRM